MRIICLALIAAAAAAAGLRAEEPAKKWGDKGEASLVTTNGNSKGISTSVKNLYTYQWSDVTGLELAAGEFSAKNAGQITAENYNASEKVTLKAVGRLYSFERFGWDKDRFAGIRNRYDASIGMGRLLLEMAKDKLNFELGGGYVAQELLDAQNRDYVSGRAYAKYEHAITQTSQFTQDAEYRHDFKDSKGYLLNTESALYAAVSTHLSLKASFTWKRNGQPPPGVVRDDTITSMALVVNF